MVIFYLPDLALCSLALSFLGGMAQSISLPDLDSQPNYTFDELYNLQVKFFDNYIYPADVTQAMSINSTLLAENIQGRLEMTGTFNGRELNTEYLFGLFANLAANPNSLSLLGVPISYEILHFTADQYIASAATRLMFNITSLGVVIPVQVWTWIAWNELGEISEYDVSFRYWEWAIDYLLAAWSVILYGPSLL